MEAEAATNLTFSHILILHFFSKINNFNRHIQTTCSNFSLYFKWLHCNVCYGAAASPFMEVEAATNLTFSHIPILFIFSKINNFNRHIQTTRSDFSLYFRWLHCNVCYGAAASTFMEAEAATDLTFSHI